MTKKKVLLTAIAALVILLAAFCIYSLLHLGDGQTSETMAAQSICWSGPEYGSEEEMAADSDLVLTGTVAGSSAHNTSGGYGSLVRIDVDEVLEGESEDAVLVFQYGNDEVAPPDEFPLMQPGEQYKLYLYADEDGGFYRVVGGYQGASKLA